MNPGLILIMLSLATFILTKLVVDLDFPPIVWLRGQVIGGWQPLSSTQKMDPKNKPASPVGIHTEDGLNPGIQVFDGEPYWYIVRRHWIPYFFAGLVECPWCVSGWLSAGLVTGTWAVTGLPVPLLYWPSVWALGALLAQHDYA